MKKAILRAYQAMKPLVDIHHLAVDGASRRKIRETWLKVFLLKRFDAIARTAGIAGFEVRFLDFAALSHLFHEIFVKGEYFFATDEARPTIVDCGSNIGMSVLYFKMLYPASRIVAFEPGEEAFSCLQENVTRNRLESVSLNSVALTAEEGVVDFYHDPGRPGSLRTSTTKERMPGERRTVEASVLSKHLVGDVDFLKMDIEGAELDVLEEVRDAGRLRRIRRMAIEYHHHVDPEDDRLSRLLRLLEDGGFGYQVHADLARPLRGGTFQDVLVYAYRRGEG